MDKYLDDLERGDIAVNKICPDCEENLVVRVNRQNGKLFLGCINYPDCNYTRSIPNDLKTERNWHWDDDN
jgi:ssDNA-binding Zn-finger/Zn-ribbon topoisomerase 1